MPASNDDFVLLPPEPQELPLPYFVDGDIAGLVGQNKIFRYVWMFLLGAPAAALISNLRLGRIPLVPIAGTAIACLAVFIISWLSLSAGYSPSRSSPVLLNRRNRQVFLGYWDEEAGKVLYREAPFEAVSFEAAFGGFGSATLNIKVEEEGKEPWTLGKYSRLIDRKESGDLAILLEHFMNGKDVIKQNPKAAAEYVREARKRPALPPEAEEFLAAS